MWYAIIKWVTIEKNIYWIVKIRVRIQKFKIKSLNVKFPKHQKQSPGDVLLK